MEKDVQLIELTNEGRKEGTCEWLAIIYESNNFIYFV